MVFVLATTDPQKVLPTIRSRTQHFEFRLLGADVLAGLLRDVNEQAALGLAPEAIDLVVRRGHGSARDALSVLDQVAAAGEVEPESAVIGGIADALADQDPGRVLMAVAEAMAAGRDPRRLATDLLDHLRNGFLATQARSLVHLPDDAVAEVEEQARRLGLAGVVKAMEVVGQAAVDMRESVDPRVTLEAALVRCRRSQARCRRRRRAPPPRPPRGAARRPDRGRRTRSTRRLTAAGPRLRPALARRPGCSWPCRSWPRLLRALPPGSRRALRSLSAPLHRPPRARWVRPRPDRPIRSRPARALATAAGRSTSASGPPCAASTAAADGGSRAAPSPGGTTPQPGRPRTGRRRRRARARRDRPSAPCAAPARSQTQSPGRSQPGPRCGPAGPREGSVGPRARCISGCDRGSPRVASTLPSRDELTKAWGDQVLASLPPSVKVYVSAGRFVPGDGAAAVFAVPDRGLLARAQLVRAEVEAALGAHFGRPVPVRLILDGDSVPVPEGPPEEAAVAPEDDDPRSYDLDDLETADPVVVSPEQRLLEAFPGAEEVTQQ